MNTNILLGLGFATVLSASWSDPSQGVRSARPGILAFEELTMHLEMDLPASTNRLGVMAGRMRSLIEMPTEVVLEVRSPFALAEIRVMGPTGRTVFELAQPQTRSTGISEISLECEGTRLREVLREFPPGEYLVQATTVDGRPVEGIARLRSRFPGYFEGLAPLDGETVLTEDVTIAWTPSQGAARYLLEIEQEDSGFSLEITLPASQTSFTVPSQILRPNQAYEYSLSVEGDTDNQLEIEGRFVTPRVTGTARPSGH